jgi:hypothetical protein
MTFPAKPTTRDLSDLPENKDFPSYSSSQAGTNTITNKDPNFGGRGSDSEATHDVVAGNVSWIGDAHDTPDLPGSEAVTDKSLSVEIAESAGPGFDSPQRTWKGMH